MENEQSKLLRKALTVIKNLQEQLKQEEHSEDKEEIAVIGMACRFPGGCNSPEEYWELLKEGKECVIDVPKERWDISAYSGEEACVLEQMYVYQSNFLQRDVSEFDAKFFRILPTEANAMDPQQRQLLEVCWEALENSGQNPVELKGSHTGVFIGISSNCEYAMLPQDQKGVNQYTGTGTTSSIAAGRISYTFGWNGPSISLDTACSSSLVSTHLAVQSLRKKECDLAISGGVNLMLSPVVYSNLCMMNAVSADGRSKPFDANGSGYGRGEGCGILVLKRLKDAMRDGDTVYAVIKGGAINNDGASSGLTVPNGKAQKMVMEDALKDAGVAPHEMSYLEAHGTGTPLGDPIEIGAVTEVFGQDNLREAPLIIGAVKGNIGHLESAAGVASLIKVVLSLYHKEIPRIVNFNELNPRLNLGKIPAILPREHMVWESHNKRRLAGISSFGFSGTNAHIVMGEAKQEEITQDMRDHFNNCLICLSAKSEQSLIEMIKKYEAFLKLQPQISLKDISYVANACHATYRHRAVFMGDNHEKLLEAFRETLAQIDQKRTIYNNEVAADEVKTVGEAKDVFARYCNNRVYASKVDDQTQPKFAFILGGEINSLQYISSELYHSFLEYKEYFNECIAYFEEYHGIEIKDKFFTNQRLTQKAADACLFATQYAMMMLFKKLNIKPEIIVGERVGQLVAATVAEIINLQDAVRLFIALNKIANECQDVAFARVYLNKDEVMDLINNWEGNLCISAIYSENECIISGKERDIDQIIAQGIDATKESGKKWPSKFYADYMSKFEQELGDITYKKPKCRYIAQASGVAINNNQKLDTSFWKESLLHPIRYDKAAEFLYNQGYRLIIQIGQILRDENRAKEGVTLINVIDEGKCLDRLLEVIGECNCLGVNINWKAFYEGYKYKKISLPNYAFAKTKYWLTPPRVEEANGLLINTNTKDVLKGQKINLPYEKKQYIFTLSHQRLPQLLDNSGVVHIGYYIEMLSSVLNQFYDTKCYEIKNLEFMSPLIIFENELKEVLLVLSDQGERGIDIEFYGKSATDSNWNLHVQGNLSLKDNQAMRENDIDEFIQETSLMSDDEQFYSALEKKGFNFGLSVRWVKRIWFEQNEGLIEIRPNTEDEAKQEYVLGLNPGIIDSCSQVFNYLEINGQSTDKRYMVSSVKELEIHISPLEGSLYAKVNVTNMNEKQDELSGTISLMDSTGKVILNLGKVVLKEFDEKRLGGMLKALQSSHMNKKDTSFISKYKSADKEEKKILVTEYIRQVMASVIGTPVEELDVNEPLDEMGLDSMMGVSFHNALSQALDAKFSFADLICAGTIAKMGEELVKILDGEARDDKEKQVEQNEETWIYDYKPKKNVKLRIFCFPYGFGSADMYKKWQEYLGPEIDVCPIKLPGFDVQRMNERTPEDVEDVIDTLETVLSKSLYDAPCVTFGHSWGSLYAYRLAYRLSKNSKFKVVKLLVSGFTSPSLPNTSLMKILEGLKLIGMEHIPRYEDVKDEKSIEMICKAFIAGWHIESQEEDKTIEAMKITIPFIMAAYRIVDRYKFNQEEVFDIPIVGFHGLDDEKVTLEDMNAWENVTSSSYKLYTLAGDHVFIDQSQSEEQFMSLLKQELNKMM